MNAQCEEIEISIDERMITRVDHTKSLSLNNDAQLSWSKHVDEICKKASLAIDALKRVRPFIPTEVAVQIYNALILPFIIWLAPRAGKMNQIARCDWLPERARWSHLARSVSRKQNFTKSHIINPLLTKFVRSRWLDTGLVLFLRVYGPRLRLGP